MPTEKEALDGELLRLARNGLSFVKQLARETLELCLDPEEPNNAATATNTEKNAPESNEQWTTAKQPAGAADTPSTPNNPGTSATTTTTGPATRDQNTNTATDPPEQPKATPNPQETHPSHTPPNGGDPNTYTCPACGNPDLYIRGISYPDRWQIMCGRGHTITPNPATVITISINRRDITWKIA